MSKLTLKKEPTLKDFQEYVKDMRVERNFSDETIIEECLLLGEEVGELFKAIRKHKTEIAFDNKNSKVTQVEEELSDVLTMLICVANNAGVDIEQAFRYKEEINKKRRWT
jgi:NTP pyrophosphatase (non-canonical NTP hydrolase)